MKRKQRESGRSREERKKSIRARVKGTSERPRLCVFRSLRYTYAQLVCDDTNKVLLAASTCSVAEGDGVSAKCKESAKELGKKVASLALSRNISKVVFDRSGYKYHGRVSAVAEGAREGGLDF